MKLWRERMALTIWGTTVSSVADDAGEERLAGGCVFAQAGDEVVAELVFDGAGDEGRGVLRFAELAEGAGESGGCHIVSIDVPATGFVAHA